jgi:hypothetical protein
VSVDHELFFKLNKRLDYQDENSTRKNPKKKKKKEKKRKKFRGPN